MNVMWCLRRLLATCLGLLVAALPAWAAPPPAEAFFQEPAFSGAVLSPDGRHVALVASSKGTRRRLVILSLETLKLQVVAAFPDVDVNAARWVNDKRLVFDLEVELTGPNRADFGPGLFAVDADGSDFRQLIETTTAFVKGPAMGIQPLSWRHRPLRVRSSGLGDDIVVSRAGEVSRNKVDYIDLMRVNTRTVRVTDMELPLHARDWVFGQDGQVLAVLTTQEGRSAWHTKQADGAWRKGADFDAVAEGAPAPEWQGPDGTLYGVAGYQGFNALFAFDKATGAPTGRPLAAAAGFDLNPQFIANEAKLLGLRYTVDAEVTQWLTQDMKDLQAVIDNALPATSNRISVPHRGDSPWVLVQAFADVQPTVSYAFNRSTKRLLKLGASLAGIEPKAMGLTDFHRIPARDGLPIPSYLTLPAGGGKNLPMVVLVHGGPWSRGADWQFDAQVQFLASRGYAVLQPAFRGSTGYGQRHFLAGFKQWGLAMQNDVADATRWAIAQGYADPKRICIAGASYGGYAALMGLVRDADLFKCGVSWVGVTDPGLLFSVGWSDVTEESKRYGYGRMIGDPVADAEQFKATSPLLQAARIQQPLLLAYGAWDVRVPLVHGEKMREALQPHNKNVEWVVYPKEGHGWAKAETRIDFWHKVEAFLGQHLAKP
jgi:dienelactone hydrolase